MKDNYLMELQYTAARTGERVAHLTGPYCAQHGITPAQLRVLHRLYTGGLQTATTLANNTAMAAANLSAACKCLEQNGLVARRRQKGDERRVVVSLTAKGRGIAAGFDALCEEWLGCACNQFSRQDAQLLMDGLDRLIAALEQCETAAPPSLQQNKGEGR